VKLRLVELVVGVVVVVVLVDESVVPPDPYLLYQPFPLVKVGAMEYEVDTPADVASRCAARSASTTVGIVTST
jgi:hypothetical protein